MAIVRNAHLCHTEEAKVRFFDVKSCMAVASHEQVRCNEDANWIVYSGDFRCPVIMIYQDGDCGEGTDVSETDSMQRPLWIDPLCIQPFHSSVCSLFRNPRSLSARLTVARPMAKKKKLRKPKAHGSNCFCSFNQNQDLSARYMTATAPLMTSGGS